MVKARCRTNLDECRKYLWPDIFVEVPRIGDRVAALGGECILKVVGITHRIRLSRHGSVEYEPYVEVELNKGGVC